MTVVSAPRADRKWVATAFRRNTGPMRIAVPEPETVVLVPSTPERPHNGEADMVRLRNGDLMLAYGQWNADSDDRAPAEIRCMTSSDGGRTWGNDRVLLPNEGRAGTYSVSLLRLQSGEILMSYGVRESNEDRNVYFRKSSDECQTWSRRIRLEVPLWYSGYTGISNNRLIQLKSGRILAAAWAGWAKDRTILGFTAFSDDGGEMWRKSEDVDIRLLDPSNKYGADDPAVVELKDGRVMMIIRSTLGYVVKSYSKDEGKTWTRPVRVRELEAPNAPATIARIPVTGDLLLIWNRSKTERRPLSSAISKDDGRTWTHIRTVDDSSASAYASITPVDDRILITYWSYESEPSTADKPVGTTLKLMSIDHRWFYQREA